MYAWGISVAVKINGYFCMICVTTSDLQLYKPPENKLNRDMEIKKNKTLYLWLWQWSMTTMRVARYGVLVPFWKANVHSLMHIYIYVLLALQIYTYACNENFSVLFLYKQMKQNVKRCTHMHTFFWVWVSLCTLYTSLPCIIISFSPFPCKLDSLSLPLHFVKGIHKEKTCLSTFLSFFSSCK